MNPGHIFMRIVVGMFWLLGMLAPEVRAQSYSIDWFTTDGGGGTSTGGVYSVSGTIGQPDAGSAMTNGNYSLTGGFWLLATVPTEGAPWLTIVNTNNAVRISWSSTSTNWTLQQNTSVSGTNWVTASGSVTDNGTLKFILVSPPAGHRFYRLFHP